MRQLNFDLKTLQAMHHEGGFEASRREPANRDGSPEHGAMLRALVRW